MSDLERNGEDGEALLFAEEPTAAKEEDATSPWKLLVVDDEAEVHRVTKMVLQDFRFEGRPLLLLHAYSGAEAMQIMAEHPDTALILLDVVMEKDTSGLEVVRCIREDLGNHLVRIVLRTGQPGQAPEETVIVNYDINDYKEKSELTFQKLFTVVVASLRSYKHLRMIEANRRGLEQIVEGSKNIFGMRSIQKLASGVLTQLCALLQIEDQSMYCQASGLAATRIDHGQLRILSATGGFHSHEGEPVEAVVSPEIRAGFEQVLREKRSQHFGTFYIGYFPTQAGSEYLVFLQANRRLAEHERRLIDVFCSNVATAYDNVCLHEELRKINETLERRVLDRTYELQRSNEKLRAEIEARKKAEQALIRAERMAAVGTLVAGIAHEFNNINVSVLGYTELALLDESLSEQTREFLQRICAAVSRAKTITTSLLALSATRKTEFAPAVLSDVVRDAVELLRRELEQDGIQLRLDLRPTPVTSLHAEQIGQVVRNLLVNAQHALLERPQKIITVTTGVDEHGLFFRVADTGCGIPAQNLPEIFTPFFSTKGEHAESNSPQARVKGTGLGLSISQTIIQNHKGEILVESKEGEGTVFTVRLPAPPPAVEEVPNALPEREKNILLFSDDGETCDLLRVLLSKEGYMVVTAGNGREAFRLIEEKEIDLVLIDGEMVARIGAMALEALRLLKPPRRPPFVMIAEKKGTSPSLLQDLPVCGVLHRPFQEAEISRQIRAVLGGGMAS